MDSNQTFTGSRLEVYLEVKGFPISLEIIRLPLVPD